MNRRTFNALIGGATLGMRTGMWPETDPSSEPLKVMTLNHPVAWPNGAFRRLLVDTHIPAWDPLLLAGFDAKRYVRIIAQAGFESVMQYAKSHVGLLLWQSKVGPVHPNMKGQDYFGEVMEECRRHNLRTVAYYSLIFDIWNFDHHPDWRILPEQGYDSILKGRPAEVCPNSPYRQQALAEIRELAHNYEFDGMFLDMTFWPYVCYCPYCTERFRKEHNEEPPRIINWEDATWRQFQKAREQWLFEFAMLVTKTIKEIRPITVYHNSSNIFADWSHGVPLQLYTDACDWLGGDFYGGPTEYSMVAKAFYGLSRTRPFVLMTSRTGPDLGDFETEKPFNQVLVSTYVATIHSAANLLIDTLSPEGKLNPDVYDFLRNVNVERAPFEPFLGGEMLADVAIYYDKESMYDPTSNGLHVDKANRTPGPHMTAVEGAARILREGHIPYGIVTNINLDELHNFRGVIVPNVLEMTEEQAEHFRAFVRNGGVLYASGPSSMERYGSTGAKFLLEDVLGVRYHGSLGTTWTYFSPLHSELKKTIWPQTALSFPGPMVHGAALPGTQVLATVTLPFVNPVIGNCLNVRFAQIWNNPPAPTIGTDPAILVHPFGHGMAIWLAAPLESVDYAVNSKVVLSLLRRVLPGPYHFEVDTHPSVEMTLFHQPAKRRLLIGLLNLDWKTHPIPANATVRVKVPSGRRTSRVRTVPNDKALTFREAGPYVEFHVEPFEMLTMAFLEYE